MLRPRQLVKLVACVPVTATTTSNVLSCKTPAEEGSSALEDSFTSSGNSKNAGSAKSGHGQSAAYQLATLPPGRDQAKAQSNPTRHRGGYVHYAPGALGTPATDSLLRAVDKLFRPTTLNSVNIVQKMSNCTNQVFKVGDAAIFKPQLAARLQQLQENEASVECGRLQSAEEDQVFANGNHVSQVLEQNSRSPDAGQSDICSYQRQVHSQRHGLYSDEEGIREVAAYTLDRQQHPTLCCNVPAAAVVEMRLSKQAASATAKSNLQIMDCSHSPSQQDDCAVALSGHDHDHGGYTRSTEHDVRLHGTLHAYRPHSGAAEDYGDSMFDVGDVQRIAVFDIRLFNTDRHSGNLLYTQNRRLVPIDHGLCLPDLRSVLRGLVNAEFAWCHWRHAKRGTLPQITKLLESDVDPSADARLLRSLGTRESCVATAYLSTIFLQWAQSDSSRHGAKKEKENAQVPCGAWTLAEVAQYLQSPPFSDQDRFCGDAGAPRRSLFARLVASVLDSMRSVHPTVAQAWMPMPTEDGGRQPSTCAGLWSGEPRPEDTEILAQAFRAHLHAHGASRQQQRR